MEINKNIAISDSGFIFNPTSGDSFSTNHIGMKVIHFLKEGQTPDHIITSITEEFDVEAQVVEKDLQDFFQMLENYQLIISHG
ncbi:MAG: PqqD family protein [Chitinophagales bacterium]|nr:PqqD family protein [Chitinophagales bacterium]